MKSSKFAIAVLCMVFSFLVTLQAKSIIFNEQSSQIITLRTEQIQLELAEQQERNDALYEQILKYKDELDIYIKQAEEAGDYSDILANRLEVMTIMAGMTDVKGTGVEVVLTDSLYDNKDGLDENYFLIHDEDLLRVINVLRQSGAEAISLNGERILATSEISCSGSTVSVNGKRYSAPYTIKAIGNPVDMENALKMRQGVVELLAQWGIEVKITQKSNMTIEAYNDIIIYRYATVG